MDPVVTRIVIGFVLVAMFLVANFLSQRRLLWTMEFQACFGFDPRLAKQAKKDGRTADFMAYQRQFEAAVLREAKYIRTLAASTEKALRQLELGQITSKAWARENEKLTVALEVWRTMNRRSQVLFPEGIGRWENRYRYSPTRKEVFTDN